MKLMRVVSLVAVLLMAAPAVAQQGEQRPVSAEQASAARTLKAQSGKIAKLHGALGKGLSKNQIGALREHVVQVEASARSLRSASVGDAELVRVIDELIVASGELLVSLDRYAGDAEARGAVDVGAARVRDGLSTVLGKLGA